MRIFSIHGFWLLDSLIGILLTKEFDHHITIGTGTGQKYPDRVRFTLSAIRLGIVGSGSGPGFVTRDLQDYPIPRSHVIMNKLSLTHFICTSVVKIGKLIRSTTFWLWAILAVEVCIFTTWSNCWRQSESPGSRCI